MQIDVSGLPHQRRLASNRDRRVKALVGGYGSGKTHGAVLDALGMGADNSPLPGIWIEPTYQLIQKVALPSWYAVLDDLGLPYHYRKSDRVLQVCPGWAGGFEVWFFSGDNPDRIVGVNAAWGVIDEPGVQDEEVFKRAQARVRHPDANRRQISLAGTPEGFNWFHKVATHPDTHLVRARTDDNTHLPPDYADGMTAHLSEQERSQYRDGEFVALGGRVYHAFSRADHCLFDEVSDKPEDGILQVWCDFNVAKMAWCLVREFRGTFYVFDEHIGTNTDTELHAASLSERLHDEYPKRMRALRQDAERVPAIVDASAKARKTSASKTDVQHLNKAQFRTMSPAANPPIRDRVASVNHALRNGRLFVNPDKAPYFASCLEQQGRDSKGNPEKHADPQKDFSHGADAIGYGIHFQAPVVGQTYREYHGG